MIEPGCVIQGESVLGEGVHLKSQCVIESSRLDDGVMLGHRGAGYHLEFTTERSRES